MVNQRFAFAVHIMTVLAYSREVIDSSTIATSVNTNPVVVRRLLLALRSAGLVETRPGKHGGAKLKKDPKRISALDIYDAVEPRPVIAISQRKSLKSCPVSCSMQQIMDHVSKGAEHAMRAHLRSITLDKLVSRIIDLR